MQISSKYSVAEIEKVLKLVRMSASYKNPTVAHYLIDSTSQLKPQDVVWLWSALKVYLLNATAQDDRVFADPKQREIIHPDMKKVLRAYTDSLRVVKNSSYGFGRMREILGEPTDDQMKRMYDIAVAYPTSICLTIERDEAGFGSAVLNEFYKGIYIHRKELMVKDIEIGRLGRMILNSAYGMIGGGYLEWTSASHLPHRLYDKALLLAIPFLEAWNVDTFIIDEGSEQVVVDMFKTHGFTCQKRDKPLQPLRKKKK